MRCRLAAVYKKRDYFQMTRNDSQAYIALPFILGVEHTYHSSALDYINHDLRHITALN